jgi:hypothetical protein
VDTPASLQTAAMKTYRWTLVTAVIGALVLAAVLVALFR